MEETNAYLISREYKDIIEHQRNKEMRNYFAANAMQALITTPHTNFTHCADYGAPLKSWNYYAIAAYQMADAMLAEGSKSNV